LPALGGFVRSAEGLAHAGGGGWGPSRVYALRAWHISSNVGRSRVEDRTPKVSCMPQSMIGLHRSLIGSRPSSTPRKPVPGAAGETVDGSSSSAQSASACGKASATR
jgi:hypothetical protein